jgi:hypothetical protein
VADGHLEEAFVLQVLADTEIFDVRVLILGWGDPRKLREGTLADCGLAILDHIGLL